LPTKGRFATGSSRGTDFLPTGKNLPINGGPSALFGKYSYPKWDKTTILEDETTVHFCNRFKISVAPVINPDFLKLPKVEVLRFDGHLQPELLQLSTT
jgi:hypothetical protein